MDLVNKKVVHGTFGKGNVIKHDDSYIKINFKSGDKRFSFPGVFKDYITFIDDRATNLVNKKIEIEEKRQKKEELIRKEERALEREQRLLAIQQKARRGRKVHPKIQSVFWCETEEKEEIFTEWKVFTGKIKSGKNKGEPRRLARMTQNSACLITMRQEDMPEKDRRILGLFMANETFDGRSCEDGYITAHSKHRIKLSEEESEKILFWNYYADNDSSNKTVWKSGRQRYFDNIWMAQILQDIASLKEKPEERKYVQTFLEYFCRANNIEEDEIPPAKGALKFEA